MADDLERRRRLSRLKSEVLLLAQRYGRVAYDSTDGSWLHVEKFPIPPGWNKTQVEILIDVPYGTPGYPSVAPQWFWVDHDLRTDDGRAIGHFFAQGLGREDERYLDQGWGHFCVHVDQWRPSSGANLLNGHSLITYLNLIGAIFHDRRTLGGR